MTENEQIEEMARFIHNLCIDIPDSISQHCKLTCAECKARYAYSKGYRKVERGEWRPITGYLYGWRCSVCNHAVYSAVNGYKCPFCPQCGADMRREKDG